MRRHLDHAYRYLKISMPLTDQIFQGFHSLRLTDQSEKLYQTHSDGYNTRPSLIVTLQVMNQESPL